MVTSCWVNGCTNRNETNDKRRFYCIPKVRLNEGEKTHTYSEERRRAWLASIDRKETPTAASRICSDHFITGKPATLYDRVNPDWCPTLKLTATITKSQSVKKLQQTETNIKRYNRAQGRQQTKEKHHVARALLELSEPEYTATPLTPEPKRVCEFMSVGQLDDADQTDQSDVIYSPVTNSQIDSEIQRLISENILYKEQLNGYKLNQESFIGHDDKVKYYTGLPGYMTLLAVFEFVSEYLPCSKDLGKFERLMICLMRLKLNFPVQDLAFRFRTSASTISRTFTTVIHVLSVRLKHKIYWPQREELRKTMPIEFRRHFGQKTAVIIDCFEIFIQRPKNLMARAQTWSSYKHNNTVKFLIGITPQGTVSFLSKAWGGRASDKYITENCGMLDKLLPGDLVLADRGFDIAESVGMCCAQVNIPSFTKGKSQLSPVDIETTRNIASVRIQVERVIGLVRNKYTMLQVKLPIDFMVNEDGLPVIDKIVTVACALSNLCESVVAFN